MRRELLLEEFVTKHACNLKVTITTIFIIFKFQAHQHLIDLYERVLLWKKKYFLCMFTYSISNLYFFSFLKIDHTYIKLLNIKVFAKAVALIYLHCSIFWLSKSAAFSDSVPFSFKLNGHMIHYIVMTGTQY